MEIDDSEKEISEEEYRRHIGSARKCFEDKQYLAAAAHLRKAILIETSRPEVYNIIGAITEKFGDITKAQKYYRASLSFDPSYVPAQNNLSRTASWRREGNIEV